jgi:hypothetical protein
MCCFTPILGFAFALMDAGANVFPSYLPYTTTILNFVHGKIQFLEGSFVVYQLISFPRINTAFYGLVRRDNQSNFFVGPFNNDVSLSRVQ